MSTAIWVVAVNNYLPELCAVTFPNLREFADRLGAEFHVITERKFPSFPPTYEKLQIHKLGEKYDWNILIDADIIIHPDLPDPRVRTGAQFLGTYYGYDLKVAMNRLDPYMIQYATTHGNRLHGIVTNFLVSSCLVHDIWEPLDVEFEECKDWCCRPHILDEYAVSRNLGKHGIEYKAFVLPEEQRMIYHINAENRRVDGEKSFLDNLNKARELIREWS
jgi:hypothetical protein